MERPSYHDTVKITAITDSGATREITGTVNHVGIFDGDWGVSVAVDGFEHDVIARTYADDVHKFDMDMSERIEIGTLQELEVIDE